MPATLKLHDRSGPGEAPFFLFFSFNAVHLPLEATKKYESRLPDIEDKNRKTYAGMLSALDDAIGGVMSGVRQLQQEENASRVFIATMVAQRHKQHPGNDHFVDTKGKCLKEA